MKKLWEWPAQAATWLVGMILLFVVKPPRLEVADPPATVDRFVQFALAIVIGIVFAVMSARKGRKHARRSALASAGFLILGILLFGLYFYFSDHWTCRYDAGDPMVVGATLLPDAAAYVAGNPGMDCATLIQDHAGQTSMIWPRDELVNRRLLLSALFSLVVVSLALAALFMIRALSAAPAREPDGPAADKT